MKNFRKYLLESMSLDFLENDDKYFKLALNDFEYDASENEQELYPEPGEEFDPDSHKFEDETEMREEAYDVLSDIKKELESNLENGKVRIFRGLASKDMKKRVNESNFEWESWSLDENVARNYSRIYNGVGHKSWLMIGLVDLVDIDYELIINRRINFPDEYEVPVKNPMNVEIQEIWNLDDDKVYKNIAVDRMKNQINYSN